VSNELKDRLLEYGPVLDRATTEDLAERNPHSRRAGKRSALSARRMVVGLVVLAIVSVATLTIVTSGSGSRTRGDVNDGPSSSTHTESGVVTGFIEPCVGLALHRPSYAAGTVTALRGVEHRRPIGQGEEQLVLPTDVVARQHVAQNQRYQFELSPGRYVLAATYDVGNMRSFIDVNVRAGERMHINLPNLCK
jgi:hypothetical protein